jgi:hypothetical protein
MANAPDALWGPTGKDPTGSLSILEVRIFRDPDGQVWSIHRPLTDKDEEVLAGWPGHGARAIAHALLVEALRREVYLCLLTQLTKDISMFRKYEEGDDSVRRVIEKDLEAGVQGTLAVTIPRMVPDIVREVIAMVRPPGTNPMEKA